MCTPSTGSSATMLYGGILTSVGVGATPAVYHHCCDHPHGCVYCGAATGDHACGMPQCGFCTGHHAHFSSHCGPFATSAHGAHFHGYGHGQLPNSISLAVSSIALEWLVRCSVFAYILFSLVRFVPCDARAQRTFTATHVILDTRIDPSYWSPTL